MISGSGSSGEGDQFRSRRGAWPRPWRTNTGEGSNQLFSRERKLRALEREREREREKSWSCGVELKRRDYVKRPVELHMVVDFFGGCFFLFLFYFVLGRIIVVKNWRVKQHVANLELWSSLS